jgi:hypothetical protein
MITSDVVLHFSRVRTALLGMGKRIDVKRALSDRNYLNRLLVVASEHPSAQVQESALVLGAHFKLNGEGMGGASGIDPAAQGRAIQEQSDAQAIAWMNESLHILPEITSDRPRNDNIESPAFTAHESVDAQEPSALAFFDEREAVLQKYIGGLR